MVSFKIRFTPRERASYVNLIGVWRGSHTDRDVLDTIEISAPDENWTLAVWPDRVNLLSSAQQ